MQPAEQGREASIGCRSGDTRNLRGPRNSSALQNPVMDKWLGYPGRLYNRR